MELPKFKSSPRFIDNVQLPCLVGEVIESKLPKLGLLHEDTKDGKVPGFRIYLRSRKPQELSGWHRQWLHKLFEQEEILPAIESGMKEYETGKEWCGYGENFEEDPRGIQTHGILPYLVLRAAVLDEVGRKILFRLGADKEASLEEHGITIFLKRGKWRFGYADKLHDYIQNLDLFDLAKQSGSTDTITDPSFLYGRWVFDEEATQALWRRRGEPVSGLNGLRKSSEEFSEGSYKALHPNGHVYEYKLIACELNGTRLALTMQYGTAPPATYKLKYDGDRLIREFVLRREGASQDPKPNGK